MNNHKNKEKTWRLLNRDGTFNVAKDKLRSATGLDLYHSVLVMSWRKFFAVILLFYLSINFIFAIAYYLCGAAALEGIRTASFLAHFSDCFFFSVQTLATIGYGKINPAGLLPNIIVTMEALVGLMTVALATGLLFARFSRPTARVLFSNVALLTAHDGKKSLLLRLANARYNQIAEAKVSVVLVKNEITKEGQSFRNPYELLLARSTSTLFAISWTLIHVIDEKSPLHGMNKEALENVQAEILVSMTGIDDTFSQTIHARYSYLPSDIVWNARFKDIVSRDDQGIIHVDLKSIHDTVSIV